VYFLSIIAAQILEVPIKLQNETIQKVLRSRDIKHADWHGTDHDRASGGSILSFFLCEEVISA